MNNHHKLIIIGSGPAGLTAGIYAGRAGLKPLIIAGKKPGGQLMSTSYVENWPGEKSILGPELMKRMMEQAQSCGTELLEQQVTAVNFKEKPFSITTHRNITLTADAIILATGAEPKRLHCPGEEKYWAKGVSTCAVCDGAFFKGKRIIIVGGGDTAMEEASFMTRLTDKITVIHILDKLTASAAMQDKALSHKEINFIYRSTVTEILGDGQKVTGVKVLNQETKEERHLETDAVFIAIGLNPNTGIFKGNLELDTHGYVKVTDHTKTSVAGIFAAGDVADYRYRQAVTSAGSGCMAALDAERYLSHSKPR